MYKENMCLAVAYRSIQDYTFYIVHAFVQAERADFQ